MVKLNTCKCGGVPALEYRRGRVFPYYVECSLCHASTDFCKTEGAAEALWNRNKLLVKSNPKRSA